MIEIIHSEYFENTFSSYWTCWLQITRDGESWMLPTTAPGTLENEELQAHFDAREDELWRVAQEKQYAPDILERMPMRQLMKVVALVMLDEVNLIREELSLSERTSKQLLDAIKAKLRQ